MTGTVLVSAIYPVGSPGGYSGTLGIPSCIGGPTHEQGYGQGNNGTFSNMLLITDGLTITLPFDHTQHGLDTFGLAEHNVPNFASFALGTVVGGNWWPNLTPTQGFYYGGGWMACGLVMPNAGNNDNCNIGLYSAEGLTGGIALGEHTHADSIRCINCDIDVTMTCGPDGTAINDHSMDISYLSTEASRIHIFVPSIGTYAQILNIFNWDPEDGGEANWHIYNANALRGEINVNLQMVNQPLKINGSCGANIANTFRAPGAPFDGSPAVPAFGTPLVNPFWRKAAVNVGGAGLTGVTIDGQAQSVVPGTYIVPSGKSITLSGTGTVQWSWILL